MRRIPMSLGRRFIRAEGAVIRGPFRSNGNGPSKNGLNTSFLDTHYRN